MHHADWNQILDSSGYAFRFQDVVILKKHSIRGRPGKYAVILKGRSIRLLPGKYEVFIQDLFMLEPKARRRVFSWVDLLPWLWSNGGMLQSLGCVLEC